MLKKILLSVLAMAVAVNWATAADQVTGIKDGVTSPLPMNGMIAAVKNGKVAFVSDNGRFVFQGTVYDTWSQKNIESIHDAEVAYKTIDVKKTKFSVDDLNPLTLGSGEKTVIVFTDPFCPSCHVLLDDVKKLQGYTFKIVYVPMLGDESNKAVRAMQCAKDQVGAKKVMLGIAAPASIVGKAEVPNCDTSPIAKRIVSAHLFGIKGVPFLIRDDGLIRLGYDKGDISNWLSKQGI
ncbi:thioredoxin fold domain-containing protein (plasmid) [Pseudomonas putida]|uniref:DsbC family protein n=1 Tax=Pseudomonas putida TaxID=303 RepID=UPI001BAF557D|nr:DsbC family protein [Pseudomonas putida]QUG93347.1 thioredoxin fold domain-containing protein [Pseudomonas putida]